MKKLITIYIFIGIIISGLVVPAIAVDNVVISTNPKNVPFFVMGCPTCRIQFGEEEHNFVVLNSPTGKWDYYLCPKCKTNWPDWQCYFPSNWRCEDTDDIKKAGIVMDDSDSYAFKDVIGIKISKWDQDSALPNGWLWGHRNPSNRDEVQMVHIYYKKNVRIYAMFIMKADSKGNLNEGKIEDFHISKKGTLLPEYEKKYPFKE